MQTISEAQQNILDENGYIGVTLSVLTTDNVSFSLTSENLVAGSFSINKNSISSSDLEIGNVETSELKFKINNVNKALSGYKYEGAEVTVTFHIGDEDLLGGKYIIDNKPTRSDIFEITALDNMVKFNKTYTSIYSGTTTIKNIILEACTQCGVQCANINRYRLINTIVNVPNSTDTTYHEVIGWCCELMGVNAYADENGQLKFGWYGDQQIFNVLPVLLPTKLGGYEYNGTRINITNDVRFDYTANEDSITITGIMLDDGTNPVTLVGTKDLAIVISDNPLIVSENITEILTNIYSKVGNFTYRPCKIKTNGYPHLWQMDLINVTSPEGDVFTSIISNHTYTLNGLSVIEGKGTSSTVSSYASPSSKFTASQAASIKKTLGDSVETVLSDYDKGVINASSALNSSHGFYETKIVDSTGKITEYYQHDQPTLAESMIVTKITEGYVGKSVDGGLTYITTISAYGATIPQLTARIIFGDQIIVGGQGSSGELIIRDTDNDELIKLNQFGITMADNTSIIGGNGVKSTFIYRSENFADLGFYNAFEAESEVEERTATIDYFVPSNFYIEAAYLYVCIYPQYAYGAILDGSVFTGYGKPNEVYLYQQSDIRRKCRIQYDYVAEDVELGTNTDITYATFGASSITPTTPASPPDTALVVGTNYTSENISSLFSTGYGRLIFKATEPSFLADQWEKIAFLNSGNIIANLVIIGYKK